MLMINNRVLRFLLLSVCLSLTILKFTCCASMAIALPGCNTTCGNLTVPYPFGIGLDGKCSLSEYYIINCIDSYYNPPKAFIRKGNIEVLNISLITGQLRVTNVFTHAYYQLEEQVPFNSSMRSSIDLKKFPIVFSDTANKLTVIGCDDYAYFRGLNDRTFKTGCVTGCSYLSDVVNGSCSGIGCCQTSIPKGLKSFQIELYSFSNHINVSDFNPQSYAFIGEQDKFNFDVSDLKNSTFYDQIETNIPIVIDWFIGEGKTCMQAKQNMSAYACQSNTSCTDFVADAIKGYRCSCLQGYEGNPYLSPGCIDIDECAKTNPNNCSHICINHPGGYNCSCPKGFHGDGLKFGSQCIRNSSRLATRLSLGLTSGFSILLAISWMCFSSIRRSKHIKKKEKFFEQNGGYLLKQQLIQHGESVETSKIFSEDELKAATNNYSEDQILGKGGYGTVYKGILKDGREVAIKKSKVEGQAQVQQFINEVVILTQINHRNVVKLLGCCLETEVPLLVYEYISNGTLFDHIHENKGTTSWLTWANCIRLATETADAIMYLHSSASIPIIHRDIKSANILLNENYTTKVSDFGASRLIPIDQVQVTTLVQGTLGYLDPEYFHTSQLTEKSDVYSFGVVLAELLTRQQPLSPERNVKEKHLATYFLMAMKEDRLMEILDPQIVREASEDQLVKMAKLVKECVNVRGEDRPTMKEVALQLEGFKKPIKHSLSNQTNQEAINFIGEQDLYNVPSSITMEYSGNYSMEISLITDINHPR